MFEIQEIIQDELLNLGNKKVKEENINEFLKGFSKEELTRFAITQVMIDEDFLNLYKVHNLNHKPKKIIIKYILDNLEDILRAYIKIMDTNILNAFKIIIKNNGKEINEDNSISLKSIYFIKQFSIAKVEYNKKQNYVKFFMPKEYIEIFNKALIDKELLEENQYFDEVFNYSKNVINTYGIITTDKLHELFVSQMYDIDIDELMHIVAAKAFYEDIEIFEEENLLCSIEFIDIDYAIDFYENQKGKYKIFDKEDYQAISDGTYVEKLKSYKDLVNYLCRNYQGIYNDIDFIRDFIVNDFIATAQIDLKEAKVNFKHNITDIIDADSKEIKKLLELTEKVYQEYPKWKKRGNA